MKIRVWDLPTRLFHWGLVISFISAWLYRSDQNLYFHILAGYIFLWLILFRLYWGLFGSYHARFQHYPFQSLLSYLKQVKQGQPAHYLGHNPLGSYAVILLLLTGLLVAGSGLLTLGMEENYGPLAGIGDRRQGDFWHEWHEKTAWIMLGLVGLHLIGVWLESRWQKQNLPLAMITGYKHSPLPQPNVPHHFKASLVLLSGLLWIWLLWFKDYDQMPFDGPDLAQDALWQEECGACHLAYHPSLLPARSWKKLLAQQHDHFAEDLYLDPEQIESLLKFSLNHAAERGATEAAWKIANSIPADQAPMRITQTPYWQDKHQRMDESIWHHPKVQGAFNCEACHLDAQQGWFADQAMHIPKSI